MVADNVEYVEPVDKVVEDNVVNAVDSNDVETKDMLVLAAVDVSSTELKDDVDCGVVDSPELDKDVVWKLPLVDGELDDDGEDVSSPELIEDVVWKLTLVDGPEVDNRVADDVEVVSSPELTDDVGCNVTLVTEEVPSPELVVVELVSVV